jgi:uncharacterized protein YodC (DUF2158 family)
MADQPFKVGDVVQLKSGGPKMTVTDVSLATDKKDAVVTCIWFPTTTDPKLGTLTFRPEVLRKLPADGESGTPPP